MKIAPNEQLEIALENFLDAAQRVTLGELSEVLDVRPQCGDVLTSLRYPVPSPGVLGSRH